MPDGADTPASTWRCFVAIEASEEVRAAAARLQEKIRRTGAHVSCPKAGNLHFTLAFLGDISPESAGGLAARLDAEASAANPFTLSVSGVGTFGSPRALRVVWAGVENSPALNGLQGAVAGAVRDAGLPVDDRPFHAHLTLARVKSSRGAGALTSLIPSIKSVRLGEVPDTRVLLMRSHLDQPNARYSLLHESPLKGT